MATPMYNQSVSQNPLELVSELLRKDSSEINYEEREQIILALAPYLENRHPTQEVCEFFIRHCLLRPRSTLVIELFSDVVRRILKTNTDFGKFPRSRTFVQEYLFALSLQNDPQAALKTFVQLVHGPCSHCPFPRVLPNLISICLSGITRCYTAEAGPGCLTVSSLNGTSLRADGLNGNASTNPHGEHLQQGALKFTADKGVTISPRNLLFCDNYLADATNRSNGIGGVTSLVSESNSALRSALNSSPRRPFILSGLFQTSSSTDADAQNQPDEEAHVEQDGFNVDRNLLINLASPSEHSHCKIVKDSAVAAAVAAAAPPQVRNGVNSTSSTTYAHTMKDEQSDLHKQRVLCYVTVLNEVASHADWRPTLASILQPIPFIEKALRDLTFTTGIKPTIREIANDTNCEIHSRLLGIREGKDGWFHLYCPGAPACEDDGELFCTVLGRLYNCCCKRRRFLESLLKHISSLLLLALREHADAIDVLCAIMEYELISNSQAELKLHLITALQSTETGKQRFNELCERQIRVREAQKTVGPRKLSLPPKSTDADLARVLASGQYSQLECLSLAFTNVTSNCARYLIQLRNLRYLNLWTTQFNDAGVLLISEHLHQLQVLNLCETQVTDKGALALTSLKKLRKLNLNSTQLSIATFEKLKEKLPLLQEVDVRYTDAW